ncbi:hypothetical protein GCM10010415_74460 [Streptomyces atrovirens]
MNDTQPPEKAARVNDTLPSEKTAPSNNTLQPEKPAFAKSKRWSTVTPLKSRSHPCQDPGVPLGRR